MNYMKFKSLCKYIALSFGLIIFSCIEEQNVQMEEKVSFEVAASFIDVKTTNFGMSTVWEEDDAICIFHSEAGADKYVNDGKFVIAPSGVSKGIFKGTVDAGSMDPDNSYDWYAVYPYSDYDEPSGVTVMIGGLEPQRQAGTNDMTHIAGDNVPMYGNLISVPFSEKPVFKMHHLTSVIEIKVKNETSEPIDIKNISITAPMNIVGKFNVDMTNDQIVYEDGENTSPVAELNVSDAMIQPNGLSSFYVVVKPFVAGNGESIDVTVNDVTKVLALTGDTEFAAGSIKTVNFSYVSASDRYVVPIIEWGISKDDVEKNYMEGFENVEMTEECLIYRDETNDYMISYSFEEGMLSSSCVIIPSNAATEKLVNEWMSLYMPVKSDGNAYIYSSENGKTLVSVNNENGYYSIGWSKVVTRGFVNGHEYVDLGLSVRWATCNVGAESPEEYGGYYAWGETKEKERYDDDTYEYENETYYNYDGSSYVAGRFLGYDISNTKYDVASVKWGEGWRMPTVKELYELITLCLWEEAEVNGVEGSLATGPNGNSVFFPNGGNKNFVSGSSKDVRCRLWTSTYLSQFYAFSLDVVPMSSMEVGDEIEIENGSRKYGLNVRAVID